jgi:hypothetical protein
MGARPSLRNEQDMDVVDGSPDRVACGMLLPLVLGFRAHTWLDTTRSK